MTTSTPAALLLAAVAYATAREGRRQWEPRNRRPYYLFAAAEAAVATLVLATAFI